MGNEMLIQTNSQLGIGEFHLLSNIKKLTTSPASYRSCNFDRRKCLDMNLMEQFLNIEEKKKPSCYKAYCTKGKPPPCAFLRQSLTQQPKQGKTVTSVRCEDAISCFFYFGPSLTLGCEKTERGLTMNRKEKQQQQQRPPG